MNKRITTCLLLPLLAITLLIACSPSLYPKDQYNMDESMLLMLTARIGLYGEEALQPDVLARTSNLTKTTPQTTQEKIKALRLLADYYRYYGEIHGGEFNSNVRQAFTTKQLELLAQADKLERRLQRGSFFQRLGRSVGRLVSFAMDRVGERAQVLMEDQIRSTIRTFVISPRNLARGQVNLAWFRLLGPFGGNAASLLRAELFPQLDRERNRLLAQADQLPDYAGDLENEILNGGSAPRSDRLPGASPSAVAEDGSPFEKVATPPDTVKVSLWGPIPAMPVTSQKTGQYYPNGGHETSWSFRPQDIVNWNLATSSFSEGDQAVFLGNFSGIALHSYEDQFYTEDGDADITGSFRSLPFDPDTETALTGIPVEMKFSGSVHQPNQYAAGPITLNGKVTDQWELDFLAFQDVEFEITVYGTLSLSVNSDETVRMEINIPSCENSQFSSPSQGATLTNCEVLLIWEKIPSQ